MEEEKVDRPESTDSGDVASASSEGGKDDAGSDSNASFSLKDWAKEELGKEYNSDEDAAKALKQLNSYVGEYGEVKKLAEEKGVNLKDAIAKAGQKPVDTSSDFVSKEQYEQDLFYSNNKGYEPLKEVIGALSAKEGKSAAEVVETDAFKAIFEKYQKGDEVDKSKSVITSNPRLGVVKDGVEKSQNAMKEYNKAVKEGDLPTANAHYETAKNAAVGAVIDSFNS